MIEGGQLHQAVSCSCTASSCSSQTLSGRTPVRLSAGSPLRRVRDRVHAWYRPLTPSSTTLAQVCARACSSATGEVSPQYGCRRCGWHPPCHRAPAVCWSSLDAVFEFYICPAESVALLIGRVQCVQVSASAGGIQVGACNRSQHCCLMSDAQSCVRIAPTIQPISCFMLQLGALPSATATK